MTGSRKYNFKCQSFPNTIEQERRRRGWTVTKLAELSGVSRYSIAAYETWAAGGIVPKQQMKSVTDTTAQMIADALEVTPEQLFKHYAEAAAEHKPRVKPFSTRAERDGAILKALEPAKYTALKMCGVLQCKDVWCEMDDVIAIAWWTATGDRSSLPIRKPRGSEKFLASLSLLMITFRRKLFCSVTSTTWATICRRVSRSRLPAKAASRAGALITALWRLPIASPLWKRPLSS